MGRIKFNEYGVSFKGIIEDTISELKTHIPIIKSDDSNVKNLIIEGENLHVLIALQAQYKGKVKFIPIDVPYFTGNNDFYYNDKFIKTEDSDANSKYCSFLYPRILLSRELLTEDGVIAVFCDKNQMFNIKTKILDPIFGETNFINTMVLQGNVGGRSDEKHIATTSEYLLIYGKDKNKVTSYGIPNPQEGEIKIKGLRKEGDGDNWSDRKDMFYPFIVDVDNLQVSLISNDEFKIFTDGVKNNGLDFLESEEFNSMKLKYNSLNKELVLPFARSGKYYSRWRWGMEKDTFKSKTHLNELKSKKDSYGYNVEQHYYHNSRQVLKDNLTKSQWDEKNYSNKNATKNLKNRVKKYFKLDDSEVKNHIKGSTPKNEYMMRDIILNFTTGNDIILDYFGGTMMTYVGVLLANQLDDENREFIGVTNNEGDHFNSLLLPNIIEAEKEIVGFKNHMICKLELKESKTEEDKFERFFTNVENIFADDKQDYLGVKHNSLKYAIELVSTMFR
jgi:adenine-specific DNA-methyltransferase